VPPSDGASVVSPVGILALQGDYSLHQNKLEELGASVRLVRLVDDLPGISGLILPGGESSAMLKLGDDVLWEEISTLVKNGLPVLATCAGVILAARQVSKPEQFSLNLIDIEVARNVYGRQIDSDVIPELELTDAGRDFLGVEALEGVFIRAPGITALGGEVQTLASCQDQPVFVRQGNVLALTFHPELGELGLKKNQKIRDNSSPVHQKFLELCLGA